MPNFDGTGPLGKGPFTGKGDGYCVLPDDWSQVENEVKPIKEKKPIRPIIGYPDSRILITHSPILRGFGRGLCKRRRWL